MISEKSIAILTQAAASLLGSIGTPRHDEAREQLERVSERFTGRIFVKDKDSRFVFGNDRFAEDLNRHPNDLVGKRDDDLVDGDLAQRYQDRDRIVFSGGAPVYFAQPTRFNGDKGWVRVLKAPVLGPDGEIQGVLGYYQEVLSTEEALEELAGLERRFRLIWDSVQSAVFLTSIRSGRVVAANPAASVVLGQALHEIEGSCLLDLCPERDRETIDRWLVRQIGGDRDLIEFQITRPAGSSIFVEASTSDPFENNGELVICVILRDITDRRSAQEELIRTTKLMHEAQSIARIGSWEYNTATDEIFGTPMFYELLDIDPNAPLPLSEFIATKVHPEDRERFQDGVREFDLGRSQVSFEYRLVTDGGEIRTLHALGRAETGEGNIHRHVGTVQDVTERKHNEVALCRANWTLQSLTRSNSALVSATSEDELLRGVIHSLTADGMYLMAWIGVPVDDEAKTIRCRAVAGERAEALRDMFVSWGDNAFGQCPVGRSIRDASAQILTDVSTAPECRPWWDAVLELGIRATIAMPILVEGEVYGTLVIYGRESTSFPEADRALFERLADDIGYGLSSLRTREAYRESMEAQRRQAEQLRQTLIETVGALAATLEFRDPYTAGHEKRVANIATAIGKKLNLPEAQLEGIRLGALVHDIGKVQVPAEILTKPRRLSAAEYELVKTHSEVGYQILKDIPFPWPIAEMVWQHHEALDGSGYPRGLKGDQILFEARILAVADMVEAIANPRPYRSALGVDFALEELRRMRGASLDAEVVDACVSLFVDDRFQM